MISIGEKLPNGWTLRAYIPAWNPRDAHLAYVLCQNTTMVAPEEQEQWATWCLNLSVGTDGQGTAHGNYFQDRNEAWKDVLERAIGSRAFYPGQRKEGQE